MDIMCAAVVKYSVERAKRNDELEGGVWETRSYRDETVPVSNSLGRRAPVHGTVAVTSGEEETWPGGSLSIGGRRGGAMNRQRRRRWRPAAAGSSVTVGRVARSRPVDQRPRRSPVQ